MDRCQGWKDRRKGDLACGSQCRRRRGRGSHRRWWGAQQPSSTATCLQAIKGMLGQPLQALPVSVSKPSLPLDVLRTSSRALSFSVTVPWSCAASTLPDKTRATMSRAESMLSGTQPWSQLSLNWPPQGCHSRPVAAD